MKIYVVVWSEGNDNWIYYAFSTMDKAIEFKNRECPYCDRIETVEVDSGKVFY